MRPHGATPSFMGKETDIHQMVQKNKGERKMQASSQPLKQSTQTALCCGRHTLGKYLIYTSGVQTWSYHL